ncbi:MAG TPA: hypothetical protein VLM75_03340 [Spirochaetota bacterium]|nr:hypothetical protein [Spirochaetota bacterium]
MILSLAADIKGAGFISSISFKFNGYHASTFREKLRVLHTPMRLNGLYMQYVWHSGRAM